MLWCVFCAGLELHLASSMVWNIKRLEDVCINDDDRACLPAYLPATTELVCLKFVPNYKWNIRRETFQSVSHRIHFWWSIEFLSVNKSLKIGMPICFARGTILLWTYFYINAVCKKFRSVSQSAKIKQPFSSCISLNVAYGAFLQNLCQSQ